MKPFETGRVDNYNSSSSFNGTNVFDLMNWNSTLIAMLLLMCSLFTIIGNMLVICAVIRERSLKSTTNYYIVSLAAADLIVGLVVMPFHTLNEMTQNYWFFGHAICDIWHSFDVFASTASINSLLAIALHRHSVISDPINSKTSWLNQHWIFFVSIIWIGEFFFSISLIINKTAIYFKWK
jgi:hypothetical protein